MTSPILGRPAARRLALLLLLLPAGCNVDPWNAPGTWRAGSSNDDNLAVMVANKHDLVAGEPMSGSDAQLDAAAIERLRTNKLKPLVAVTTSTAGGSSGGGN